MTNDDRLRRHGDRLGHVSESRELAVRQAPKDVDGPDEGGNQAQLVQANQEQSSALKLRKISTDLMRGAIKHNQAHSKRSQTQSSAVERSGAQWSAVERSGAAGERTQATTERQSMMREAIMPN